MTIDERVSAIEKRNSRVEGDKAWENSYIRRGFIALLTYLAIGIYMSFIGIKEPFLNAVIPTTGFILSTLSLSFVKHFWLKYIYKK